MSKALTTTDRVVARLQTAEKALRQARTIPQFKVVADVAAAQKVFSIRQKLGAGTIAHAHWIETHALIGLGQLLEKMPKRSTKHSRGGGSKGSSREPLPDAPPTLADLGITKKVSSVAQQLASLPDKTRQAIADGEESFSAAKAKARRTKTAKEAKAAAALPNAKYRVIYADPPWSYSDKATTGAIQSGGAEGHYPSLSIAQLCKLDIASRCQKNAVLFLWVTAPLLAECWPVIKAWGFTYKASFVWDKIAHNMGHYNSVRHEFLLICTRGSCTPDDPKQIDSVQSIKRGKHSAKPEAFRKIIDGMYPHGRRLELFARGPVPKHWQAWGNE